MSEQPILAVGNFKLGDPDRFYAPEMLKTAACYLLLQSNFLLNLASSRRGFLSRRPRFFMLTAD